MFHLNKMSQVVSLDPEITLLSYEARLNAEGFTGGYYPLTGYQVPLQICLAERTPNHYFLKYGGIEDLCVGGKVRVPSGEAFQIKNYPRAATGSDLRRVVLGSQGLLGSFEEVSLKIFSLPESQLWGIGLFDRLGDALECIRMMLSFFIRPQTIALLNYEEGASLFKTLNLPDTQKTLLAFKLSGLASMVEAEKDTLVREYEGKKVFFYWSSQEKELKMLDEKLISEASYLRTLEKSFPLLGPLPDTMMNSFEKKLSKHFEELT